MERERKFLLKSLPADLDACPHQLIEQGYLAVEKGWRAAEARIRKIGKHWVLTVKTGRGEAREEKEMPISPSQAHLLWGLTKDLRVKKVRYKIPYQHWTIELDVYRDKAKGLRVAEVEFGSQSAARRFKPPPWFGREVTGQKRYSNVEIAERGWKRAAG